MTQPFTNSLLLHCLFDSGLIFPITINHIESTHKHLNGAVSGTHSSNLSLRLAKICQYMKESRQHALAAIAESMPPIDLSLVSYAIETQLEFSVEHELPPEDSVKDQETT